MKIGALVLFGSVCLASGASAQGVNDAQIAAIVVTANQVDIDAGKLAASIGRSSEVKKFVASAPWNRVIRTANRFNG